MSKNSKCLKFNSVDSSFHVYTQQLISLLQFLLGIFYYVEAAVLLEDFEDKLNHTDGHIDGVEYFNATDITQAYHTAAL